MNNLLSFFLEMSKVILWNIISLGITVKNNKLLNKLICIQTNLYVRNIEFLSRKKKREMVLCLDVKRSECMSSTVYELRSNVM